ncbi:MAG: glycosyltransferase [Oscillospiraceae bacterium]|nr:glycosyltransferase [Oscillospiraceae bacterium]
MNDDFKYSVLMSVYIRDNPEWLKTAIDSMLGQTFPPNEFIIVKDGEITEELNKVLTDYEHLYPGLFKIIGFEENRGVGQALGFGAKNCTFEYIAKMDADDYCVPERIEKQVSVFRSNPRLGAAGCLVYEFIGDIENITSCVMLPENHADIVKFAKKRCPIRHSALLIKKEALLDSGSYGDIRVGEDYDIIVKMLMHGYEIFNIQEFLVYMRINPEFFKRRGGIRYLKNIFKLKNSFKKIGFFSTFDFLRSFIPHAVVCLLPNFARDFIYRKLLRKRCEK